MAAEVYGGGVLLVGAAALSQAGLVLARGRLPTESRVCPAIHYVITSFPVPACTLTTFFDDLLMGQRMLQST